MKKIILIFCIVSFYYLSQSQDFMLEVGKTLANFNYKNSSDLINKNFSMSNQNSYGIGFAMPIIKPIFKIQGNLSYFGYYMKGNDTILKNSYEWDSKFLGTSLLFVYEFVSNDIFYYQKNGFSFYLLGGGSLDFLLSGKQTINNNITNLKGVEQFDKPFLFAKAGIGTKYYVSQTVQIYAQYVGGTSFLIFDNYTNQEKLRFVSHNFSIGLSINLYQSSIVK